MFLGAFNHTTNTDNVTNIALLRCIIFEIKIISRFILIFWYRRRQSNTEELGYENKGMMVENPLYGSTRKMRAAPPYMAMDSPDDVFAMRNIAIW